MTLPLAVAAECSKDQAVWNPLCGVTPNPGAWGPELGSKIGVLLSGIWWLSIVACVLAMLVAIGKWAWAKKVSHSDTEVAAGTGDLKKATVALVFAIGFSAIMTAAINFAQ